MINIDMFNWKDCIYYQEPYPYIVCDNFLLEFDESVYPNKTWCDQYLGPRENDATRALSACYSLDFLSSETVNLLNNFLSQEFYDNVCRLLGVNLIGETTGIRKTIGNYRIAREAQIVENSYTENNILEMHYDNPCTIWTGVLYFVNSEYGSFNIHDETYTIVKKIPVRKNRMIITLNSNKTWHSVSSWLETTPRKSIYTTAEFKNDGRDQNRMPINTNELWIK
jgi:hypothetical protein